MEALDVVNLSALMERTKGTPQITVGLIDGPVVLSHPALGGATIRELPAGQGFACAEAESVACMHGTFIIGMLAASRDSEAPGICPNCHFLLRPIFSEEMTADRQMPTASPSDLAAALVDCMEAGADLINLSLAITQPSSRTERELEQALDLLAQNRVIVAAAAGNQGAVGSTTITRHPWVIPVVACDTQGKPLTQSNLSRAIAQGGLRAPGERITSLGSMGKPYTSDGTSVATPFVTGAAALLWSLFPDAGADQVKFALCQLSTGPRRAMIPRLLDAQRAYELLRIAVSS